MNSIKLAIPFAVLLVSFAVWAASADDRESMPLKEQHASFDCADCHGDASPDRYYLVNSDACLSCHGSRQDVADLTARLDKDGVNPHRNFHSGTDIECYECHREHKPSRNYCGNCHDTDLWMNPVP